MRAPLRTVLWPKGLPRAKIEDCAKQSRNLKSASKYDSNRYDTTIFKKSFILGPFGALFDPKCAPVDPTS